MVIIPWNNKTLVVKKISFIKFFNLRIKIFIILFFPYKILIFSVFIIIICLNTFKLIILRIIFRINLLILNLFISNIFNKISIIENFYIKLLTFWWVLERLLFFYFKIMYKLFPLSWRWSLQKIQIYPLNIIIYRCYRY